MKNVFVYIEKEGKINKKIVHRIVSLISRELRLTVSSLELNFVTSNTIKSVNKKYLRHNYSTDIITFDYSTEKNNLDGEIFISLQDSYENSKKYKVSYSKELLRLIVHGILHMCGYDDKTISKKKKMKLMEDDLVKRLTIFSEGLSSK